MANTKLFIYNMFVCKNILVPVHSRHDDITCDVIIGSVLVHTSSACLLCDSVAE